MRAVNQSIESKEQMIEARVSIFILKGWMKLLKCFPSDIVNFSSPWYSDGSFSVRVESLSYKRKS